MSKQKTSKKQPIFRSNRMDYKYNSFSRTKENIDFSGLNNLPNYKRRHNFASTLPFNKKINNIITKNDIELIKVKNNLQKNHQNSLSKT